MLLWNIIRDFFVRYIFGGYDSLGELFANNWIGTNYVFTPEGSDSFGGLINTGEFFIGLPNTFDNFNGSGPSDLNYLSLGDYLSTTATIIVMVLLCFLLVKLAIWIFKLGANLIRLR